MRLSYCLLLRADGSQNFSEILTWLQPSSANMCVCVVYMYAGVGLFFPKEFSNVLKIELEISPLETLRSSLPVDWGIAGERGYEDLVSITTKPVLFPW